MINKYKNQITIVLIGFMIYFILGMFVTYHLNTFDTWGVMFEIDTPRVVGDLTLINYDHYRIAVHPLFIILFQPTILLINIIIKEPIISSILLQSIISSLSLSIFYTITKKITTNNKISLLITTIFGLSFPQIVYTSNIETYIFAQFFLLLLWLFAINKVNKKFKYWDYIILILLGIGSIAITITNFFQFIFVVLFIYTFNQKNKHRIVNSIFIIITSLTFSIVLANIQNIIWPTAPNFFTKFITDFIHNTSEESAYLSRTITLKNFMNVINSNYAQSYNIFSLIIPNNSRGITFKSIFITDIFSIISFIIFIILNVRFLKKNKNKLSRQKIYWALLISYTFNFILHILYGNDMPFLYICHYNFIIVFIIIYILNNDYDLRKINNKFICIIYLITIVLFVFSLSSLTNKLFINFNIVNKIKLLPYIIIILFFTILSILINKYIIEVKNEKLFRTNKN